MFAIRKKFALLALTAVLVGVLAPSASARPRSWTFPGLFVEVPCSGSGAPAGQDNIFSGFLVPTDARYASGEIWVTANLVGPCGVTGGEFAHLKTTTQVPAVIDSASCDVVTWHTSDVSVDDVTVELAGTDLVLARPAGFKDRQFCALARAVDSGRERRIATIWDALLGKLIRGSA